MEKSEPEQRYGSIREEALRRRDITRKDPRPVIHIGMATCGIAAGALDTRKAFEEVLSEEMLEGRIHQVGCLGHCYAEPLVIVENPGFPPILYYRVTPGKARMIAKSFLRDGDPLFEHLLGAMEENEMIPRVQDYPRFGREMRVITERCGRIDPEDIYEYVAVGGYSSLLKSFGMEPEEILGTVRDSGLRGRGGAGFPTGVKWSLARKAGGSEKTIICNADEGDPGAYMDRTILESNPHQVLEGMAISGRAIGAEKGVVYVRAEYPLAVRLLRQAVHQAEELGLLGDNILGSGASLRVEIFEGSGAFVCGEETALIRSIEGQRGMPKPRPPFPVEKGLWNQPTVINNVKTFATIPPLLERGAAWYREMGTADSPGTVIFSVVGDVVHPGLVEIPTGVNLRSLIFDICGGVPNKKSFKAVQIGGPSGGCLPSQFLDTPIDFQSLTGAGAMMGSGGMVVMNEDACMVDVARYFLDFTQKESCGKCTFCRIGTFHLLRILERVTKGEGREEDLQILEELSLEVKKGSLCALGKTAPNPVITSLCYFRDEYESHVREKRCPSMMCRTLTAYYIDLAKCARGCDACVGSCPVEAIYSTPDRKKAVDQNRCVKCGECMVACPKEYAAVKKVSPPLLALFSPSWQSSTGKPVAEPLRQARARDVHATRGAAVERKEPQARAAGILERSEAAVEIRLNGAAIRTSEGINLLQVCLQNGIYVPNLCYLEGKGEPQSSCRLCFVEIDGNLTPSCTVKVKKGMVVRTDTPDVRALQKAAFRLLMSVHRVDCSHCPANKRCELQRIARFLKVGLNPSGLDRYYKDPELIREHPSIDYYPNRCVLCGRCVRTCLANSGRPLMTFARRGFNTIISFYGSEKDGLSCSQCGACIGVCPVSALLLRR